jgi:hypothetical protein
VGTRATQLELSGPTPRSTPHVLFSLRNTQFLRIPHYLSFLSILFSSPVDDPHRTVVAHPLHERRRSSAEMYSSSLAWWVFSLVVGVPIVLRTRTWLRLRHIPGPPTAGFSELWLLRKTLAGRAHLDTAEACEKYGAVLPR